MSIRNNLNTESPIRSLLKAVTWRLLGALTTLIISYAVTGNFTYAISIVSLEVLAKVALFYFHERLWALSAFGK